MTVIENPPPTTNDLGDDKPFTDDWKLAKLPKADNGLDATLDGDLGPILDGVIIKLRESTRVFPEQRRHKNVIAALDGLGKARQKAAMTRVEVDEAFKTYRPFAEQARHLANLAADASYDYQHAAHALRTAKGLSALERRMRKTEVDKLKAKSEQLTAQVLDATTKGAKAEAAYRKLADKLVTEIYASGDVELAAQTKRRLIQGGYADPATIASGLATARDKLNETGKRHRKEREEANRKLLKADTATRKKRKTLGAALDRLKKVRKDHDDTKKKHAVARDKAGAARQRAAKARDAETKASEEYGKAIHATEQARARYEDEGGDAARDALGIALYNEDWAELNAHKLRKKARSAEKELAAAENTVADLDPDRRLLDAMAAVRKALPKGSYDAATFEALETTAKVAVMDKSYEAVKKKLIPNFKRLGKVGSKDTSSINIEFGASLNAVFARIDVTTISGLEVSVERTGNGKFKGSYNLSNKTRVAMKGGVDAPAAKLFLAGGAEVGQTFGTARTYDTLEDLITSEANLLMTAVMSGKDAKANRKFLRERAALLAQDYQNRDAMLNRLITIGALKNWEVPVDPSDPSKGTKVTKRFKTHPRHRVDMVRTESDTVAAAVDAMTVASMADSLALGGGVSIGAKTTGSRDYKTVSFIDDVMGNDGLQKLHAYKNGRNFGFMEYDDNGDFVKDHWGDGAVDALTKLGDEINKIKTVDDAVENEENKLHLHRARNKLRAGLEMLRMELDGYVQINNQIDDGQIPNSSKNTDQRDHFAKLRGIDSGSKAQYIKALSVQYAMMRDLYENTYPNKDGKPVVPPGDTLALNRLKDDLQTPRMKLSDKDLRDTYGVDAVTDESVVKNKTFAANFTVGAFGQDIDKSVLDNGKEKTKKLKGAWGVKLAVSYSIDAKTKGGKTTKSTSLVLDIGEAGSFRNTDITKDPVRTEQWATAVAAKILSRGDLAAKVKNSGVEAECKAAIMKLAGTGATVQFDFAEVNGKLRLKSATAFDQKTRKTGGRTVVPTGVGVDVVVGMNIARTKKHVRKIYHGSNTLTGITDAYRSAVRNGDGTENGDGWDTFKKDSKLLNRMVRQLGNDDFLSGHDHDSDPKKRRGLGLYLQQIRDGEKMKGTDASRVLGLQKGKSQENFGMINEVVDWVIDLKTSSDKGDQKAADSFIETYLKNRDAMRAHAFTKHRKLTAADEKGAAEVEKALNNLILAKAKKEDRTAADDFNTKRGFDTADLNGYVSHLLADHMDKLVKKIVVAESGVDDPDDQALIDAMIETTSVAKLRRRVLRRYQDQPTAENYDLVKEALALDYASKSLDDLTMYNDEADKNKAIGMLGADLADLLKKSKVYVNDMIEADLARDEDGKTLKLTPVVKKGMAKVVKANMLQTEMTKVQNDLVTDATPEASNGDGSSPSSSSSKLLVRRSSKTMMVSDYGGVDKEWKDIHYDSKARQEYFKKRGDKANYWFFTKSRAKKNLSSRNKETSISAMLEKVMNARAEKLRRQRERDKQKRKKQLASATSSTNN